VKIAYFCSHFPYPERIGMPGYADRYSHGGTETVAYYLAVEMARRGHEVSVFTASIDNRDAVEEHEGVTIHRYATRFRIESANIAFGMFRKPLRYDADIVHAHFSTPPGELAGLRYAGKKHRPLVVTYHGDAPAGYGTPLRRLVLWSYNTFLLGRLLRKAAVITVPSEYYIDESRFLGNYRDKIAAVPNGVHAPDLELPVSRAEARRELGLPVEGNVLLFVGDLVPYKGPDVLLRALPAVFAAHPEAFMVYAGRGELRETLERQAAELGLADRVRFAGFVSGEPKARYFKAADLFVLPSPITKEVFPIVLLEASLSGLPMVVSDLRTFRCIIEDGRNGLFTRRGDAADLAAGINRLLGDDALRADMSRYAREKSVSFTWPKIAEDMERLYLDFLGR
jgi:glycosyltransferase involved in cell wall biosynthesis